MVTHHVTAMALSGCLVLWASWGRCSAAGWSAHRPGGSRGHDGHRHRRLAAVRGFGHGRLPGSALGGAIDQVLICRWRRGQPGAVPLGDRGGARRSGNRSWLCLGGRDAGGACCRAASDLAQVAKECTAADPRHHLAPAPRSLLARLTARGAELAQRSAEFVFVGASFVTALAALAVVDTATDASTRERLALRRGGMAFTRLRLTGGRARRYTTGVVMTGLIVLFLGGAILGIAPWARSAGSIPRGCRNPRSVSPQGIAAAAWTLDALGPGRRFLSDRTSRVLLATYGRQHPISSTGDKVNLRSAYFGDTLTVDDQDLLTRAGVEYVIADHRLPTSLPYVGVYVERGEQFTSGPWTVPMDAAALDKVGVPARGRPGLRQRGPGDPRHPPADRTRAMTRRAVTGSSDDRDHGRPGPAPARWPRRVGGPSACWPWRCWPWVRARAHPAGHPPLARGVRGCPAGGLALPGIALTRAMFPGRGMGRAERIALIIGIQFALVILSGSPLRSVNGSVARRLG